MRFKRGQKGHDTRQFERGALKGKFLPRGGHVPLVPPPPVPPPGMSSNIVMVADVAVSTFALVLAASFL